MLCKGQSNFKTNFKINFLHIFCFVVAYGNRTVNPQPEFILVRLKLYQQITRTVEINNKRTE